MTSVGQVEVGERLEPMEKALDRVAAAHRPQDGVVARLERDVQVATDRRRLAQGGDEVVVDVVDLDRGEAEPRQPRTAPASRTRRGRPHPLRDPGRARG